MFAVIKKWLQNLVNSLFLITFATKNKPILITKIRKNMELKRKKIIFGFLDKAKQYADVSITGTLAIACFIAQFSNPYQLYMSIAMAILAIIMFNNKK